MEIALKNISKSFNGKKVIKNFTYTFTDEYSYCIIGESGSGKTTLINIIAGLLPQDSGEITGTEGLKRAMVFQENRLMENLSVIANINAVLPQKADKAEILNMLEAVNLTDCQKKTASELSGGMKRRVAILRALAVESTLLIMDEPFKGLDGTTKNTVMNYVKEKSKGKIFIFVTHDKSEADFMGSLVVDIGLYGS